MENNGRPSAAVQRREFLRNQDAHLRPNKLAYAEGRQRTLGARGGAADRSRAQRL